MGLRELRNHSQASQTPSNGSKQARELQQQGKEKGSAGLEMLKSPGEGDWSNLSELQTNKSYVRQAGMKLESLPIAHTKVNPL